LFSEEAETKQQMITNFIFLVFAVCPGTFEKVHHNNFEFDKRDDGFAPGGEKARKGEWPWLVAFVYQPEEAFICGGSLISDKHILSGEKTLPAELGKLLKNDRGGLRSRSIC
jgi:hypothetical protein